MGGPRGIETELRGDADRAKISSGDASDEASETMKA